MAGTKAVYLGPSDAFVVRGKEYHVGDAIPDVSREELFAWMNHGGHKFDVTVERPNAQPETLADANTERGEVPLSVMNAANRVGASAQQAFDVPGDIVPVEGAAELVEMHTAAAGADAGSGTKPAGKPAGTTGN